MYVLTMLMTASTVALAGIGGLYYSYACSVMPGLRRTDDSTFVRAMSHINAAIQNPWFALSFFGAFISLAAAAVYSWIIGYGGALPVTIAWGFYTATLAITMGVNIPLNERLARLANTPLPQEAAAARRMFEARWTRWNLHRTWLSLAGLVCLGLGWAATARP